MSVKRHTVNINNPGQIRESSWQWIRLWASKIKRGWRGGDDISNKKQMAIRTRSYPDTFLPLISCKGYIRVWVTWFSSKERWHLLPLRDNCLTSLEILSVCKQKYIHMKIRRTRVGGLAISTIYVVAWKVGWCWKPCENLNLLLILDLVDCFVLWGAPGWEH